MHAYTDIYTYVLVPVSFEHLLTFLQLTGFSISLSISEWLIKRLYIGVSWRTGQCQ